VTAPLISNVSDTARWVAVYRAWETARPDALFRDPYAERLAGERGKQIVAQLPMSRVARNGWLRAQPRRRARHPPLPAPAAKGHGVDRG